MKKKAPFIPPPAPPVIIRQSAPQIAQQEALVIREAPPKISTSDIGRKIVKIAAPRIPPPARKLIVEKLPAIANQAQSIIIERWLAPKQQARRIVYQGGEMTKFTGYPPIKNEIIEYDAPKVTINKQFKNLGVTKMNPEEVRTQLF